MGGHAKSCGQTLLESVLLVLNVSHFDVGCAKHNSAPFRKNVNNLEREILYAEQVQAMMDKLERWYRSKWFYSIKHFYCLPFYQECLKIPLSPYKPKVR